MKLTGATVPSALLTLLGVAVFERLRADRFALRGTPPNWLMRHWPALAGRDPVALTERFLFLAQFVHEDAAFGADGEGHVHASGPWAETAHDGRDVLLEAFTVGLDGQDVLLIKPARIDQEQYRRVLQKSRELSLEHYALQQSIDQREVLLHCLIHDLATPLAGARSSLTLLREDLSPRDGEGAMMEAVDLALRQVEKAQRMLRDVPTMSPEAMHSEHFSPNLVAIAQETMVLLRPAAQERGVQLAFDGAPEEPLRVVGEARRLERVLFNLIDNALRYAPPGTAVTLRLDRQDGSIHCQVCDAGAGVPAEQVPRLFRKFEQGAGTVGRAGLGLYYCRITVEGWGGAIGYREAPSGGACFWFRLPAAHATEGHGSEPQEGVDEQT